MRIKVLQHQRQELFFSMLNFGDVYTPYNSDKDTLYMKVRVPNGENMPFLVGFIQIDTGILYYPNTDFRVKIPRDVEMGVEW